MRIQKQFAKGKNAEELSGDPIHNRKKEWKKEMAFNMGRHYPVVNWQVSGCETSMDFTCPSSCNPKKKVLCILSTEFFKSVIERHYTATYYSVARPGLVNLEWSSSTAHRKRKWGHPLLELVSDSPFQWQRCVSAYSNVYLLKEQILIISLFMRVRRPRVTRMASSGLHVRGCWLEYG